MSHKLKLTAIGNSTGIILPKEVQVKMNVTKGDGLYLTETRDGYVLSPFDEEFAVAVKAAEGFMKKYRDVLRELAK